MRDERRRTYEAFVAAGWEGSFPSERPPMFSPAISVQDRANPGGTYSPFAQLFLPFEYAGWEYEAVSWVGSCYIGDWTSLNKRLIEGPDALAFLQWLGMNDLDRFDVGQVKHHVQLDDRARVASEGILLRLGESEFQYTAGSCNWLDWQLGQGDWSATARDTSPDVFIFGVQGPTSLATLESATGQSLRDIAFNRSRVASIGDAEVRMVRSGISGELGYELHGSADDAPSVWAAVVGAGEGHGIQQLGIRTKPVQHIEAGIATNGLDYFPSAAVTPGAPTQFRRGRPGGSFVPSDFSDYFRHPSELGWGGRGGPTRHDHCGRAALEALGATRTLVGLRWHDDDVVGLFASLLTGGERCDPMELPRARVPSFDSVFIADEVVGISTGRTLSLNVGATISLCVIVDGCAALGTEVEVLWGRPGTNQRRIRAEVTTLPFKPDHRRVDVSAL